MCLVSSIWVPISFIYLFFKCSHINTEFWFHFIVVFGLVYNLSAVQSAHSLTRVGDGVYSQMRSSSRTHKASSPLRFVARQVHYCCYCYFIFILWRTCYVSIHSVHVIVVRHNLIMLNCQCLSLYRCKQYLIDSVYVHSWFVSVPKSTSDQRAAHQLPPVDTCVIHMQHKPHPQIVIHFLQSTVHIITSSFYCSKICFAVISALSYNFVPKLMFHYHQY